MKHILILLSHHHLPIIKLKKENKKKWLTELYLKVNLFIRQYQPLIIQGDLTSSQGGELPIALRTM